MVLQSYISELRTKNNITTETMRTNISFYCFAKRAYTWNFCTWITMVRIVGSFEKLSNSFKRSNPLFFHRSMSFCLKAVRQTELLTSRQTTLDDVIGKKKWMKIKTEHTTDNLFLLRIISCTSSAGIRLNRDYRQVCYLTIAFPCIKIIFDGLQRQEIIRNN